MIKKDLSPANHSPPTANHDAVFAAWHTRAGNVTDRELAPRVRECGLDRAACRIKPVELDNRVRQGAATKNQRAVDGVPFDLRWRVSSSKNGERDQTRPSHKQGRWQAATQQSTTF
jgi:hypothetical protein